MRRRTRCPRIECRRAVADERGISLRLQRRQGFDVDAPDRPTGTGAAAGSGSTRLRGRGCWGSGAGRLTRLRCSPRTPSRDGVPPWNMPRCVVAAVVGRGGEAAAVLAIRMRPGHRCDGPWCCGIDSDTALGLLATVREHQAASTRPSPCSGAGRSSRSTAATSSPTGWSGTAGSRNCAPTPRWTGTRRPSSGWRKPWGTAAVLGNYLPGRAKSLRAPAGSPTRSGIRQQRPSTRFRDYLTLPQREGRQCLRRSHE